MGRRRRPPPKKRTGPRRPVNKEASRGKKIRKLHTGKLDDFDWELKKVLDGVEGGGTIFANVYSKSTNIGVDEAIKYVNGLVENGNIDRSKAREIIGMLNRFSRFR